MFSCNQKSNSWSQTLVFITVQTAERVGSALPASPASLFELLLLVIFAPLCFNPVCHTLIPSEAATCPHVPVPSPTSHSCRCSLTCLELPFTKKSYSHSRSMEKGSKNTCSSVISAKPEGTEAQRRETCNNGGFGSMGRHLGVPVPKQGGCR